MRSAVGWAIIRDASTVVESLQEITIGCSSSGRHGIDYLFLEEKHLLTQCSCLAEIHEHSSCCLEMKLNAIFVVVGSLDTALL